MNKSKLAKIPLEITEDVLEIYQEVLDCGNGDAVAVRKIQDLLKTKDISITDRTVYKYLEEWKRSGTIRSIVESFNVELQKPGERVSYVLGILTDELKKSVDKNEPASNKIRLADAMHRYIETEIKIEVLRGKRTTSSTSSEDSAKIVVSEKNED